jgi:hypothetical protein
MDNQETLVAFGTQVTERRQIKQTQNTAIAESWRDEQYEHWR